MVYLEFRVFMFKMLKDNGSYNYSKIFKNQNQIIKLSNNENLKHEYQIYQKIKNNHLFNIPKIFFYHSYNIFNYIVIENVGISLNNIDLSVNQIFKMYNNIKKTIEQLKKINIVHRDIKPSNITIKNSNFYLIDYNLAAEHKDIKTYFFGNWEFCSLQILKHKILSCEKMPIVNLTIVVNNDFISLVYVSLYLYTKKFIWSIKNVKDKFNLCQKSNIEIIENFKKVYNLNDKFILFLFNELKKYKLDG